MLNRKSDRATAAEVKLTVESTATKVITVECDLQSFASVRAAAVQVATIAAEFGGLDTLVNNAGIMGFPDNRTGDGFDVQMQTNHLSHFLLTKLLMPSLDAAAAARGEARIVQHSSGARSKKMSADQIGNLNASFFSKCDAGTLGGDSPPPVCFNRYHQTKLANSVFMAALHHRLTAAGKTTIKSVCAEPGVASTSLGGNLAAAHTAKNLPVDWLHGMAKMYPVVQSPADGCCPLMYAAFSEGTNAGDFYMPKDQNQGCTVGKPVKCMEGAISANDAPEWISTKFEKEALTMSKENQDCLWAASEAAVGESFAF